MNLINYLNQNVKVKVDKPLGSKHQKYGFIYTVNCGFVSDTINKDGEQVDCYVLGVFEHISEFIGKCIAIIHRINDNNDKLIIVPENRNFSNKEIDILIEFQERFFKHEIIRADIEFNSLIPELSVSNIETSKYFYEDLGFKIVYERPENKFCFMQLENNQIMLEENNGNWNVAKMEYPYGNGINISMSVEDVENLYKTLKEKQVKFFFDLEVNEYKVGNKIFQDKEFLLQDPDGYLLRFNN